MHKVTIHYTYFFLFCFCFSIVSFLYFPFFLLWTYCFTVVRILLVIVLLIFILFSVTLMFKNLCNLALKYRFANEIQKSAGKAGSGSLTFYKDGQLTTRQSIVLKQTEDIEAYVIKTIQNYYRSTYKQGRGNLLCRYYQR